MPVDSSIVLGIRPAKVDMPDPLERYARALQVKGLGMQNEQAEQNLAETQAYREAAMQSGGDLTKLRDLLYAKGAPKSALAVEQARLKAESERSVLDKNRAETMASEAKQARDALAGVNDQPSYDNFLGLARQRGWQVAANAPQQFDPAWQKQHLFTADEFITKNTPKYEKVDVGGEIKMVDTNPVTNPGIATTNFKKVIGPDAALHARVQAATADPFNVTGVGSIVDQALAGQGGGARPAAVASPTVLGPAQGAPKGAAPIPVSQALQDAIQRGVNGDDFLKALPPDLATQVKSYADGRQAFPSGFALKSPYFQTMLRLVGQYDPNFDAVNYNARAKTRSAFTSGPESKSLNALNTVMGHLDELDKAGSALNNSGIPFLTAGTNAVLSQLPPGMTNNFKGRLNQFNITKQAVVDEMERAYRGAGGSQSGIDAWKSTISSVDSYPALRSAIQQGVKLLNSKIEALGDQYNKGMGTTKQGLELLNPHAQATFNRLIRDADEKPQTASGSITPTALPTTNSKGWALHVDAKGNRAYVSPDGKQYEEVKQ